MIGTLFAVASMSALEVASEVFLRFLLGAKSLANFSLCSRRWFARCCAFTRCCVFGLRLFCLRCGGAVYAVRLLVLERVCIWWTAVCVPSFFAAVVVVAVLLLIVLLLSAVCILLVTFGVDAAFSLRTLMRQPLRSSAILVNSDHSPIGASISMSPGSAWSCMC